MRRFAFHPTRTAALLGVLVLALWLATTLGLLHRAVHGQVGPQQHAGASHEASPQAHAPHGLFAFFGDHTDAECRLYDQLSHGPAALCVPPVFLPVTLPAATFAWLEGEALVRWVALFEARGPPSAR
jgi:hypothetical protein